MNLRTPNPLDTTMDADAIMDWDREWADQPGTAHDDGITLADWERGRAARARAINPELNLDRMPEAWLTNGRKRGRPLGVGKRQTRRTGDVVLYQCSRCRDFKVREDFYAKADDPHRLQSHCRQCTAIVTRDRDRARRAARRAQMETAA